jgi:ABC-type multidrug transport system ATPase subunit
MKPCPHCGTSNAEESRFCRQCGRELAPLTPTPSPGPDATVRWDGKLPRGAAPQRVFSVPALFAAKSHLLIGRAPECDVVLPHPSISRHHARVERLPQGLRLRDLGSLNGLSVNGLRQDEILVQGQHQLVGIGPFLLRLAGDQILLLDSSRSLRLEARHLEKIVRAPSGEPRKLLEDVNLAVEPGEFVSLLGPSGSGKSTLMDCLNGRRPATGGTVLANGEDFYRHFDSFRQSLGYVPQRDIVHTQISVYRALYYTALLRLPPDTDQAELTRRIGEVLDQMELKPHRDTVVASLSGGQVKRVSLGAELLARPCLLYMDEATSGLDAGTEARMMRLFRHLADEGKSVICITHNVDNVDLCDLILVLARGRLVYHGPPAEARAYFEVSRLSDIYDRLASQEPDAWHKQFAGCSLHKEFVEKRLQPGGLPAPVADGPSAAGSSAKVSLPALAAPAPAARRPPLLHQFWVLTLRYLELLWRDYHGLRLLLLQAPLVAAFILLGFCDKPYGEKTLAPRNLSASEREALKLLGPLTKDVYDRRVAKLDPDRKVGEVVDFLQELPDIQGPVVPYRVMVNPRYTYILLFLIVVIVLWFGCNNAAKEIVKEEAIYSRERAVNLGILPYLASKFLVLTVITALQALMLLVLVYGIMELLHLWLGWEMPWPAYQLDYVAQFGVLVVLSMTGVALGLLLSASAATPDRATTLLPYVLIPQVILGGGILPIAHGPLHVAAVLFSPAYWAYRAVRRGATSLPPDLPVTMHYNDSVLLACTAMVIQTVILLLLTTWALRQKDVQRA